MRLPFATMLALTAPLACHAETSTCTLMPIESQAKFRYVGEKALGFATAEFREQGVTLSYTWPTTNNGLGHVTVARSANAKLPAPRLACVFTNKYFGQYATSRRISEQQKTSKWICFSMPAVGQSCQYQLTFNRDGKAKLFA